MADEALKKAEQALDVALRALEQSEKTSAAAVEAINTVADALQELVELLCEDEDEGESKADKADRAGEGTQVLPMPPLSGEVYPEYAADIERMKENGDDDPVIPLMHVAPIDDTYEHELSDKVCWCKPRVESKRGVYIVVHNADDDREQYELPERVVN